MLYKVFDFADKEVSDVMVPRPEVVALSVDLPPEEALQAVLDSPYTRYPVYRELARRRSSASSTCATCSRRCTTAGSPTVQLEEIAAARVHGPGDEGPRGAADRVPAHEPAHGDRRRRVRRHGGHRHARGPCSRRSSARSRTSSTCRTSRSSASTTTRSASTARSRSTTSTSSSARAAAGGLPHGGRLRLRPARPRAGARRRDRGPTACASRSSTSRHAHRAARGRVPAAARAAERGRSEQPRAREA